jgi:hypothetical protein
MSIEAMTKAREAIELLIEDWTECFRDGERLSDVPADNQMRLKVLAAMRGLREAIAKAEKQTPVAYRWKGELFTPGEIEMLDVTDAVPLYQHPRKWVGLTEADIRSIDTSEFWEDYTPMDFARVIEAQLKELNT